MVDAFLISLRDLCSTLLPVLGAAALIYLCIVLKHLWKLIDEAKEKVEKLDPTIAGVNSSLEKIQAPLDTLVRFSHSADKVSDKAADLMNKTTEFFSSELNKVKKNEEEGPVSQPKEEEEGNKDE
jgi:uncharacterized protein YoxC